MRTWLALAVSVAAAAAAPSFAHAGTPASVVMLSDPGDWVGGGSHRIFHSRNAHIALSGGAGYVTVSVSGGTSGDYYDLDFAAPPGQQLVPAVYVGAQRAPFREAGHAGIDISGSGRDCNTIEGSFEVREITVGAGGAVERLWVIYEQHCEGGGAALFGEVRIGGAAADGAPLVTPSTVRWPPTDATRPTTVVPVTVAATEQPVEISGVSLGGSDAAHFLIRADECTGRSLAVGGSCQVWLRSNRAVAGTNGDPSAFRHGGRPSRGRASRICVRRSDAHRHGQRPRRLHRAGASLVVFDRGRRHGLRRKPSVRGVRDQRGRRELVVRRLCSRLRGHPDPRPVRECNPLPVQRDGPGHGRLRRRAGMQHPHRRVHGHRVGLLVERATAVRRAHLRAAL